MKQIELELKKRLLIVELDDNCELQTIQDKLIVYYDNKKGMMGIPIEYNVELICKGSELTEEIAMELVMEMYSSNEERMMYRDYNAKYDDEVVYDALESFISAIEAQGYYWGENPIDFNDDETDFGKRHEMRVNWEIAESKTFNPNQTLIFEILL